MSQCFKVPVTEKVTLNHLRHKRAPIVRIMCRRMFRARGLLCVAVLLSFNILLVTAQRGGRLSTSLRGDKPRWIPRSIPASSATANTLTSESPADDAHNSTAISGLFGLRNKVADRDAEKDVLPTTKSEESAPSDEVAAAEKESTPTTTTSSSAEEEPKEEDSKEVVSVAEASNTADEFKEGIIVRAENLKEATKDSAEPEDKKVPAKRDLPFAIQSSPGIVKKGGNRQRNTATNLGLS